MQTRISLLSVAVAVKIFFFDVASSALQQVCKIMDIHTYHQEVFDPVALSLHGQETQRQHYLYFSVL